MQTKIIMSHFPQLENELDVLLGSIVTEVERRGVKGRSDLTLGHVASTREVKSA
jgi:hypothetical protein